MTFLIEPGQDRKVAAIRCRRVCDGFLFMDITKENIDKIREELSLLNKEAINNDEIPVSALLLYEDAGVKVEKSHNLTKKECSLSHAEINVIRKALEKSKRAYFDDAVLFVTLEPCLMCMGAILKSKIKKLFYFADDEKEGAFSSYHLFVEDKIEVVRCYDERYVEDLSSFFKKKRD